ncbi:MAG: hypothetical protein H0V35_07365 [Nitrospira sp.]|nr:hypothetical protein [Nitrospira sp.]
MAASATSIVQPGIEKADASLLIVAVAPFDRAKARSSATAESTVCTRSMRTTSGSDGQVPTFRNMISTLTSWCTATGPAKTCGENYSKSQLLPLRCLEGTFAGRDL